MENKIFESQHTIRFTDCDPFNHLNNSRYIDYFINAREDHLLQFHDFSIHQTAKREGLSWVVSQNQISYLKPAMLMEQVIIDSTLLKLTDKKIQVEMKMWDSKKTHIKSILWISFTHFDLKTGKSATHAPDFYARFKSFENPNAEEQGFDERVKYWRNQVYQNHEQKRA